MTLHDIAALTDAQWDVISISPEITGVASVSEAGEGDVSSFYNPKYIAQLRATQATAVFVPRDFSEEIPAIALRVDDPAEAFKKILALFAPPPIEYPRTIHPTAIVAPTAKLGSDVHIGAHVIIEDDAAIGDHSNICAGAYIGHGAMIGTDCHIGQRVCVMSRTKIGVRVIVHPGAVLGSDGFGYEFTDGAHNKIPQTGIVQIDDDVEIGANTTIDRARFGRTWIKQGVKIDNLCQIGHNVIIDKHSILCAQVGVSGSTRIGKGAILAGQAGISGHLEIGDQAIIAAKAGITKTVPAKATMFGSPALPALEYKRIHVRTRNLHKLIDRVAALEKQQAP